MELCCSIDCLVLISHLEILFRDLIWIFVVNNNTSVVIVGIEEDIENEDDETLIFGIIGTGAQASVIITSDTTDLLMKR